MSPMVLQQIVIPRHIVRIAIFDIFSVLGQGTFSGRSVIVIVRLTPVAAGPELCPWGRHG